VRDRRFAALYWLSKLSDGVSVTAINTNSRRARRVVKLLEELGLARVESFGRVKVVRLTEKGERVKLRLADLLRELEAAAPPTQPLRAVGEGVPDWLRGNPWLRVIGERGRA